MPERWFGGGRSRAAGALLAAGAALVAGGGCVVHPRGTCGPACAAIEAATTVELESERMELLQRVAAREKLSQHEQTYLVNAICFGGLGGPQADALITLIGNPCCTAETRRYIARNLRFVTYSAERKRVAEALGREPGDPPPGLDG